MLRMLFLAVGVAASLFLTSCSSSPESEWTDDYEALDPSTLQDQAQKIVDCLDQAGFPGYTATFDGGVASPVIPEGQEDVYDAAFDTCFHQLNPGTSDGGRPTQTQLEALYGYEVAAWNCLKDLGYETPQPPSFQVFEGKWGTADQWSAWRFATDVVGSDYRSAQESCPDPEWFTASIFSAAD